ncbi:hypothetical protein F2Q69_00016735 [Brassica cretica]|uniref:Uncharacterized protein n=1 Tax=Brassica cretica TaxID=69181 RepID=A0A8S9QYM8_BRACR|nr:hypothetical protein F2Q69_00016735 [Brassica cretica]
MDSAFPPGLPRSPTGSKGNQKAQNETEMKANSSDRLGSEHLDLGNKESLRLEDTTKHKAENLAGGSVNGGVSWGSNDKEKEKESGEGNEVRVEAAKEINREDEIEEGEMVENWQDVTPEKASRNSNLKFGQVKILTPSRFSNLLEVDEKGDSIIEVESEEILSVVKEIVEENVSIIKEKEAEGIEERGIADENKGEVEGEKENKEAESQNQGIAGIPVTQEDWPDLAMTYVRSRKI